MRIIIELKNTQDQSDVSLDYHKLQGFVYSVIKNTFPGIHEKKGYKPFSYSNIFPYSNTQAEQIRKLIIATPGKSLGGNIFETLKEMQGNIIHIGDGEYELSKVKQMEIKPSPSNFTLLTDTPIIIRIPERNYDKYNIANIERKKGYIYWRPSISFEAFAKQLTENLVKKYNDFYGTELEQELLFERYFYQRMIHSRMVIKGKSYGFAASMWRFEWQKLTNTQEKVLEFAIDAGFGERNSMGFGFVSPVLKSKK